MRDPSGERAIGEPRKSLAWNPGSKVREKRTTGVVRGLGAGRNHPQAAAPVTRTASAQGTTARPGARGRCSPVVETSSVAVAGGCVSAPANCAAQPNRAPGTFASAFLTAASSGGGTPSRGAPGGGGGSARALPITDWRG